MVETLKNKEPLTEEESYRILSEILSGSKSEEFIKSFLLSLSGRGESVEEITGLVHAMKSAMNSIELSKPAIDVCGTGGSNKVRFNVSTVSSFLIASCGVPVAKHGNVGSKMSNGSFDFLDALNVPFNDNHNVIKSVFDQCGLAFLFARYFHPAVRYVGPARKAIGKRTVFNILGPLSNPANVEYQIIGTTTEELALKLANVAQQTGKKRVLVVVGGDGRDELSTSADNLIIDVTQDRIEKSVFSTQNKFLPLADFGGDAHENAETFRSLFLDSPKEDALIDYVAVNSGLALYCYGKVDSILDGYHLAKENVFNGRLSNLFNSYCNLFEEYNIQK